MSRAPVLLVTSLLICGPALAQDKPIPVYFEPSREQPLNDAIAAALTQPPFVLHARIVPGALVVTVPDGVDIEHRNVSGTTWSFTVLFSRDGTSLGQSVESCNEQKLTDCTDQLVSDVKSAAGMSN